MKINIDKKHISLGITSFLVVASSICFYYLLFHGDRFLGKINAILVIASPVIYGIILAYLLTPIVNTIEKKTIKSSIYEILGNEQHKEEVDAFSFCSYDSDYCNSFYIRFLFHTDSQCDFQC